jgi:uncharacterized protein (DUF58 family)
VRRRVVRVLRAIGDVVQPLGWVLIATAVLVWWLAFAYGWREFLVIAAVITVTLIISLGFLFGRTTYEIGLDLTRTRVVVGERAVGGLMLANRTPRTLLPSEVILPVGAGRGVFQVPRLAPTRSTKRSSRFRRRHAACSVGPVSVRRGDPLGLFERAHDRRQAVDLYVHPQTTALEGLSLGHLRDLEGLPVQHLARDDVSFHALREYQPGDDLRHVHWKSTARVGEVMVRQYEETRRSHFVVGLSTLPDEYREAAEFELAISVAGSIGLRALRDSASSMRALSRAAALAQLPSLPRRALDARALARPARRHRRARRRHRGPCTGCRGRRARHGLAHRRGRTPPRVLAIAARRARTRGRRRHPVDAPALQRIGEADVVTVGALDQLPRAVRKVLS